MKELVLGCGAKRKKMLARNGDAEYSDPTYVDINPDCDPHLVWDLNDRPLPFADGEFDEIHAYEVLEHIGRQGDWRGFFEEFSEYYRILKPGGYMIGSCPMYNDRWAWADPGHTRVITKETFIFLDQDNYAQVGETAMTDYRFVWSGDFKVEHFSQAEGTFYWVLKRGR